jgi:threonine/homoserine/homoserine lactone efflux protein
VTIELWSILIPIAIATTLMPVELTFTLVMLRSPGGRDRAAAWIAGKTVTRLAQYALLAGILTTAVDDGEPGTSPVEGALLLVVAMLLLVAAARKAANQPDEDAPPPRWMTTVAAVQPGRAFLFGAGWVAISPKLWAFTLAAIGAIADADLGAAKGWLVYVVFILMASGIHLAALALAVAAPARADRTLGRVVDTLERHSRPVLILVSAAFGLWFLVKALRAFGIL